ncbi:hypothetical protein FB45DRAFT_992166 [Roridomyces roridus]|uniref:Uncharacterized protein n=1 Tax=Roridomyces roridus TaxID=1738132 RepID=A0AAD7BH29_9AGAR|nr:hypothetical protein FB45DRAFT_992166 [Roridomyces roridus]
MSFPPVQTYSRRLGQNELSYFLPSRANGVNDMSTRIIIRAPPALVSPIRLQIVWAFVRLRHSLLASHIEMAPGRYDEARFIYTPPSSPEKAVEEAGLTITIHDDKTGPELDQEFIVGPSKLSSKCLGRMYVARHGQVSPGIEEYHIVVTLLHAITDGTSRRGNLMLELLGGSDSPGGPPRSDEELMHVLEAEWKTRWGHDRVEYEVITPSAEARLPPPRSRLQMAAWRIDSTNVQRRAIVRIGAHTFPRISNPTNVKQRALDIKFDRIQTATFLAKCQSERVTLQNAVFALCNFAWIRTARNHPEIHAPKTLPMMMYTAISLVHLLQPVSPLASPMSLALGYGTIILPGFIPSSTNVSAAFWLRARSAQSQMRKQTRSPMLPARSQIQALERARRAKMFAKLDDEADGTLPKSTVLAPPAVASRTTNLPPSIALMGVSHLGDLNSAYQTKNYPEITFVDSVGHARKAPGGILLFTRSAQQCFSIMLEWDGAAIPSGLVEEFWGHLIAGVDEFILSRSLSKL